MVEHNGYCADLIVSGFTLVQVLIYKKDKSFWFGFSKYNYLHYGKNYRKEDINRMLESEVNEMLRKEIDRYIETQKRR